MSNLTLLGKPIQFVASAGFNQMYGGIEAALYIKTAYELLQRYPFDMFIFEMPDSKHYQVRIAGYHLQTEVLEEQKVIFKTPSLEIKKFWMKIDGTETGGYVGTFLFPDEY